ncbi:MAG: CPBP family intramembrane metalloprotease, partial [Clostridia bacterium]|nr:CPBP family intramembrane metalloprotease [Clostridia bacterium]
MKSTKKRVIYLIALAFIICSIIKDIEFLFIKTDTTVIGENVICKIVCIITTVFIAHKLGYKLTDIGFKNKNVLKYAIGGLGLGITTFA